MRKPRADDLVQQSAASGRELHLSSGEKQAERDLKFRQAGRTGEGNPGQH